MTAALQENSQQFIWVLGKLFRENIRDGLGRSWNRSLETLRWRMKRGKIIGWIFPSFASHYLVYPFRQLPGKADPPRIQLGRIWVLELRRLHNHYYRHTGSHTETQLLSRGWKSGGVRRLEVLEDEVMVAARTEQATEVQGQVRPSKSRPKIN